MSDLNTWPLVKIKGAPEVEYTAYEFANDLEKAFPDQDARDFAYAVEYHIAPSTFGAEIQALKMIVQGSNDGDDWVWYVESSTGHWVIRGGCDYTGWDCQSWAKATEV